MPDEGGVRNVGGTAKHGSYAFWPGSGPTLYRCVDCRHGSQVGTKFYCQQYWHLTGRRGHPIPRHSHSCKYFELKTENRKQETGK